MSAPTRLADFRSLSRLVATSPTARVLNLVHIHRARAGAEPAKRLFACPTLEQCLIVKHRLRPHEYEVFHGRRTSGTKVLLPFDVANLQLGAASIFVGERGWRQRLTASAGLARLPDQGERDFAVLEAIDALPSLDPFLLREHLRARGFAADESYFAISASDIARMAEFTRQQMAPLVELCLGGQGRIDSRQSDRLARKLLYSDLDVSMEPLRQTLHLGPEQFEEGMFCWKGFLYYKWVLDHHVSLARNVALSIRRFPVFGQSTIEQKVYLGRVQEALALHILRTVHDVKRALGDYDRAFERLTGAADPGAFRDFLLAAPRVFASVGEKLGAVQHIVSFWRYRVGEAGDRTLCADDLIDILRDFEASLGAAAEETSEIAAA